MGPYNQAPARACNVAPTGNGPKSDTLQPLQYGRIAECHATGPRPPEHSSCRHAAGELTLGNWFKSGICCRVRALASVSKLHPGGREGVTQCAARTSCKNRPRA